MAQSPLGTTAGNAVNAGFYDPYARLAEAKASTMGMRSQTGIAPGGSFDNLNVAYLQNNPVVERQRLIYALTGIDIGSGGVPMPGGASWGNPGPGRTGGMFGQMMGGLAGGQGGPGGGFEGARGFAEQQAGLLNQGFDQTANLARTNLQNSLLAQGGESALSSGQGQAAMTNLEGQLAGQRSGNLASMTQSIFPAALQAQGQQQQTMAQQIMGLLQLLSQ